MGVGMVADVIQRLQARGRKPRNGKDGIHGREDLADPVFRGNVLTVPEIEDTVVPALGEPVDTDVQAEFEAFAGVGLPGTLCTRSGSKATVGGEALLNDGVGGASFREESHGVLSYLGKDS
jgi:hypothetical protein